jgi:SAM-dependent methyltransferase
LQQIVNRRQPSPWADGDNIPWNDPAFSKRMLAEHLSQSHNAASRRSDLIDAQVGLVHDKILHGQRSMVLDLGCGPGLYLDRLARLGHSVTGIDHSPASIAHARQRLVGNTTLIEGDLRQVDFGGPYDLVMMLSGELNVFRPADQTRIARKARASLMQGACFLIELSTYESIQRRASGARWHWFRNGLWSDEPHGVIEEAVWDGTSETTIVRYYVVDQSGNSKLYSATYQAFSDDRLSELLDASGLQLEGELTEWRNVSGGDEWKAIVAKAG